MPRSPRARLLPGLCLLLPLATPAHAATEESQFWLTEQATFHASAADSVTIDSSQRLRSDARSGGEQFLARIALDHAIAPHLQLGGGIAYLESETDKELRLFQRMILTKGVWLSRTQIEQRFFSTADEASWRLRQRVQAAIPIDRAKRWTVIAATEIFFHLNRARPSDKTGLAMMRHQIGLRHPIARAVDAQLLYMRQQNFRDGRPDIVSHIPWLTLSWRL
ncbi:DUF2490 domain-containing protein [Sphingobium sp. HBC34]|uniref:DUF2490 domain-containing protein n=1 Tax=Sphingobium cyanobacteriorum TaxID=3063954 RepID=A0ABT8ZHN7_9SPHN|nr:DUF2490 domain-containing protein [Sphingobium sp. HBC34]MDO7833941.1 DUF2490 domain-containing protein [Sphingobium sp. HBC34]